MAEMVPYQDPRLSSRRVLCGMLAATLAVPLAGRAAAAPMLSPGQVRLPPLDGEFLTGAKVHLPDGLPAPRSVVIVTQKREHSPVRVAWAERLGGHSVPLLDLALFDDYGALFRDMVIDAMLKGIKDPASRAGVVMVFGGRAALTRQMGIDSDKFVHALVVERASGAVVVQGWGDPTTEAIASIQAALHA